MNSCRRFENEIRKVYHTEISNDIRQVKNLNQGGIIHDNKVIYNKLYRIC